MARVNRMASVTSLMSVSNSRAISLSTKTRRKKSNASSVQPRKVATTTLRCWLVQPLNAAIRIISLRLHVVRLDRPRGAIRRADVDFDLETPSGLVVADSTDLDVMARRYGNIATD